MRSITIRSQSFIRIKGNVFGTFHQCNPYLKVPAAHFFKHLHNRNGISKGHWHSNVFSFPGGKCNLGLQFGGPNHRTHSIGNDSSNSWLSGAGINLYIISAPISRGVCITMALKAFGKIRTKFESQMPCLLQVSHWVDDCFAMFFSKFWWILSNLMSDK